MIFYFILLKLGAYLSSFLGFYYCDGCQRKYRNAGSLIRHKRYECGLEPQFRCDICLKSFTRNTTLRDHRINIHNINYN